MCTQANVIPYPKPVCIGITLLYTIYCHAMSLIGIALLLSQIDFFIVRVLADLAVTSFALTQFLRDKTVSQGYSGGASADEDSSTRAANI